MTTIRLHLNYDQVEAKSYLSHCPISILLYRSSRSRCSLRRQGRASIFRLSLRMPPIASDRVASEGPFRQNAASDILAKRTQCCPTPERQLAHPKSSAASSWSSSADTQRLRLFKNTAMPTPGRASSGARPEHPTRPKRAIMAGGSSSGPDTLTQTEQQPVSKTPLQAGRAIRFERRFERPASGFVLRP